MPSVMAIISKAVFTALPQRSSGSVVALDRYTSKHPAFGKLGPGDSIFLVTVRPTDRLFLVACLDEPKRVGDALVGKVNTTPIRKLPTHHVVLADGTRITAAPGRLAMALQTPRLLAEDAVARLRGIPPAKRTQAPPAVEMSLASRAKKPGRKPAPAKLVWGELGPRATQLLDQIYRNPDDRALRGVFADQLLEDHHAWGELISLQLSNSKQHRERIQQLVRRHSRDLAGEIANVAAREDQTVEDGFLIAARCGKSKSFTRADQRTRAALAPQWATVKTVTLTWHMPWAFVEQLLHNPASANLTRIDYDSHPRFTALSRKTPASPWEIASPRCEKNLLACLPDAELARIPTPKAPAAQRTLEAARAERTSRATKRRKS